MVTCKLATCLYTADEQCLREYRFIQRMQQSNLLYLRWIGQSPERQHQLRLFILRFISPVFQHLVWKTFDLNGFQIPYLPPITRPLYTTWSINCAMCLLFILPERRCRLAQIIKSPNKNVHKCRPLLLLLYSVWKRKRANMNRLIYRIPVWPIKHDSQWQLPEG